MNTAERLHNYYDFDEDILAAVQDAADVQNKQSFLALASEHGLTDGPLPLSTFQTQVERPFLDSRRSLEYIEIKPQGDYDETKARLLFTPMGIPVDESIAMRAMRLFAADPREQLMVVGSPALIGNRANILRLGDVPPVSRGDLRHVVGPALKQLENNGVRSVATLGYSYGAETAATASAEAARFDIESRQGVWVESAAVAKRGIRGLLNDFARSGKQLERYIADANSRPLYEAREMADKGFLRYAGGMTRLSNVAIAATLATDSFKPRVERALTTQPDLRPTIAWGQASELAIPERMEQIVTDLRGKYPFRVGAMALEGMHHAGGDDIDLHAAIMLQGLR